MLGALIFSVVSALISLGIFGVQSAALVKKVKSTGLKFNNCSNLRLSRRILVKSLDLLCLLIEIIVKCILPAFSLMYILKTLTNWNDSIDEKINGLLECGIIIDDIEPVRQEIAKKPNKEVLRAVVEVINTREGRAAIIYASDLEEEQPMDLNPEGPDRTEIPKVRTHRLRK